SRVVAQKREATRETPRGRAANVKAVAQTGLAQGTHVTEKGDLPFKREPLHQGPSFQPVPLGNTQTLKGGGVGVGVGRDVHRSGSQEQWGAPAGGPKPAGRDIWADFPGKGGK